MNDITGCDCGERETLPTAVPMIAGPDDRQFQ